MQSVRIDGVGRQRPLGGKRSRAAMRARRLTMETLENRQLLAVVPTGGEFRCNAVTLGAQDLHPGADAVAVNSAGDFVVTFHGSGPGDANGVFAQRWSADGAAQGGEFRVNTTRTGVQQDSAAAMDDAGNFAVVWSGAGGGDPTGVFVQRYRADGARIGGEVRVNSTTAGVQQKPVVAMTPDGRFVVAWCGMGREDSSGVFFQRFAADGKRIGGETLAAAVTRGIQRDPAAAMAPDGRFAIAWSGNGSGDSDGIYLQRFRADGGRDGAAVLVNSTTGNSQDSPAVAIGADGELTVAWSSASAPGRRGVCFQRFDGDGTRIGGETRVGSAAEYAQANPSVAMSHGWFVVSWESRATAAAAWRVLGEQYDPLGQRIGGTFAVDSGAWGDARYPAVAMDGEGYIMAAWAGAGAGDRQGVYGRRLDGNIDYSPPDLAAALAHDTGAGAQDGVTADPTITGQLTDASRIVRFQAGLDAMPEESFVDVSAGVGRDGAFTLDRKQLAAILGAPLADGPHALRLRAADEHGNAVAVDVPFVLQTALFNQALTSDGGVQQMPTIAVDPLDPYHVVTAYLDYSLPTADGDLAGEGYAGIGVAVSFDGGDSWQRTSIPLPAGFDQGAANPIAKFDDQGRVFVVFMADKFFGIKPSLVNPNFWNPERGASDRALGMQANNGIFVARSVDGGGTWAEPVAVAKHTYEGADVPFVDSPDIAVDTFRKLPDGRDNPNYGAMYVAWTHNYPASQFPGDPSASGGGDVMIAVSRDAGQTWETRLRDGRSVVVDEENLGDAALGLTYVAQPHLSIGPEGNIYLSQFGAGDFAVHVSTDGAQSFVGPERATGRGVAFGPGFTTFVNTDGLPNNRFRTHTMRAMVADPVRPGYVYAVDPIRVTDAAGNQIDGADVYLARSTDSGATWQRSFLVGPNQATALNDDNGGQSATGSGGDEVISGQALARLAIDANGNIGVIWYDTRRDPANHRLDVFGTISTDGGATFTPNFRISDVSFDADEGAFTDALGRDDFYLGDFIGLAMGGNTAYAAWTDTRAGNQDVVVSRFAIDSPPAPLNDRFEPNDAAAAVTDLGRVVQRVVPKLALSLGDSDWFRVQAAATGELVVAALPAAAATPSQFGVQLWNEAGTTLLGEAVNTLDPAGNVVQADLRYPAAAGQAFLMRMSGDAAGLAALGAAVPSGAAIPYALRLQSLTADLGTRAYADVAGSVDAGGGALYQIAAAAAGSLDVQVTAGADIQGGLVLSVLDPKTFAVIASGQSPGVSLTATSTEPNDSIAQANATGLGGAGTVTLDGLVGDGAFASTTGDYDFYRIDAGASQQITVSLDAVSLSSSLDAMLLLFDAAGNLLAAQDAASTGGNETLTWLTDSAGAYYVAVLGWESGPPADPFTAGTGAGAGSTGPYRLTIADVPVGPGAIQWAALPVQQGQTVLLLVSGEGQSHGSFQLQATNLDQYGTTGSQTLLFPAGAGPSQVTLSDFNRDGKLDVAVSNALSNTLSNLLGNGDGTFQSPRQSGVGAFVQPVTDITSQLPTFGRDVAAGDFNGDGIPDAVVTNYASSDISVLLGRGDGSFEPQRRFDATFAPMCVDVGDVTGDGVLDLAVASRSRQFAFTLAILVGRGDGWFFP